jgi:hypothetical protein
MPNSFTISKNGTYPTERYFISPDDYNSTIFDYGEVNAENLFRFYNNPRNDINSLSDPEKYNQIGFDYDNSSYYVNTVTQRRSLALDTNSNINTFKWSLSSLRSSNLGPVFNFLCLNFSKINVETPDQVDPANLDFRSYLLYPQRIFLKPVSVVRNGTGSSFTLTTSSVIANYNVSFFNSITSEYDAFDYHLNYLKTPPQFLPIVGNSSPINLIYSISAFKNVVNNPIIKFSKNNNPIRYTRYLESSNVKIRPDSTFVLYNNTINYNSKDSLIGEYYTEQIPTLRSGFRSSFIENINLNSTNNQTFQLIQSTLNLNKDLEDPSNAIANITLNLSSCFFTYSLSPIGGYYVDGNNRVVTNVKGVPYSTVQARYVAESPFLFNSNIPANYNVTTNLPLNSDITYQSNSFDKMTWGLLYPVWYYTFKTAISNTNFKNYSDNFNLDFNVSPIVISQNTSSALISCCLVSNHNTLKLDLPTYAPFDYISLNIVDNILDDKSYQDARKDNNYIPNLYSKSTVGLLSCFYGSNYDTSYDLNSAPYIPIDRLEQNGFKIISSPKFGEFDLVLRPSLSTLNTLPFGFKSDSQDVAYLRFYAGKSPTTNFGYPIYLNIVSEEQDKINLDCSALTVSATFPQRDLRNSKISWSYSNNSPLSANIKIYSLNKSNIPTFITPNSAIDFNPTTWNVFVSGYGPYSTTIKLSSQKYKEVADVNTDEKLFDYLRGGSFIIGLSGNNNPNPNISYPFINKGDVLYFTLTAKVLNGSNVYEIPDYIPLYWSWNYNSTTQPLTAYDLDKNVYSNSTNGVSLNLSALSLAIKLTSSVSSFERFIINFNLNSNYRSNGTKGSFPVEIENYPDFSIFNTDFNTIYYGYSALGSIADTRKGINVITRPKDDYKWYQFIANNDVLPKIKSDTIKWTIKNDGVEVFTKQDTNFKNISSINYNFPSNVKTSVITLCAQKAYLPGWSFKHDIYATTTINLLSASEFYNPPKFIVYPKYTWQKGNSGYITIIDQSNYTNSIAPTSYQDTINGNQYFYLSANRIGTQFDYLYGKSNTLYKAYSSIELVTLNEKGKAVDLKYSTGLPISLTAYSELYPKYPNIQNLNFTSINSSNQVYTDYFRITSATIPFNYLTGYNAFYQNPITIPYDTFSLKTSTIDYSTQFDYNAITQQSISFTPVTSINLENNLTVAIIQTIVPPNTANSPVRLYENLDSGSVTYMVSSRHWVEYISVPAFNGIYELFTLYIGDATKPFTVSPYVLNPIVLSATSNFKVHIPPTTFNLYSSAQYTGNRNLWSLVDSSANSLPTTIYVYTTSVKPDVFISNYFALTGEKIRIEFQTPDLANQSTIDGLTNLGVDIKIVAYDVYFGDGSSQYHSSLNDVVYHSYKSEGTYTLSYDVYYNTGQVESFELSESPIKIYNNWPEYDQSQIRLLNETQLTLPWSIDQVYIQPNEFGDVDIFNTAISRLYDCLDYLKSNTQTINTDSPTLFYGWLGYNKNDLARNMEWHTPDFNNLYYTDVQNATAIPTNVNFSYFSNLIDIKETRDYIFAIDGTRIRAFYNGKNIREISFENIGQINQLIKNPVSIDYDSERNNLYVCDNVSNKIYKLNLSFDYISEINIQLIIGNYGSRENSNKFFAPSKVIYLNNKVYVLDLNNQCVKQYTQDLNWVKTYYTSEFNLNTKFNPITFDVHPTTSFVYILTNNFYVYVFDNLGNYISNFKLIEVSDFAETPKQIFFDENGDFLYVVTKDLIFKYTILGTYISILNIPNGNLISYVNGKSSFNRSLIFSTKNSILKVQDIVTKFAIGQGLPYNFWTREQTYLNREEFTQDINYNRAFTRLIQNIKSFRNIFDSLFVIATHQEKFGTVRYFTKTPISVETRPVFSSDIENETVMVGVNEFNIPQVINRELKKIYDALLVLNNKLTITSNLVLTGINTGCQDPFCWSWNAMSCYKLTLPVIRICNINPITYAELESNTQNGYNYAQTIDWGSAKGTCCDKTASPLDKY